ncbi:hypothetical protein LOZ57_002715 [Ophidiomyces ophidiicola]|nr:uncharacterized protein LOZ57_002715 [Ophidiomyces ophidiicola]KAI1948364.1 hypothetical protein LOZ57_002715 [Ophidiomyces ophidiicola]KAI2045508.1 hypothetical protein LOZ43_006068 [Ophidiomyces ophidiicola]
MNSARNLYRHDLDFRALALEDADFARCLKPNGQLDFNNPDVVRFNYILWLQDLVDSTANRYTDSYDPERAVAGLDIGTGASCIYPLLGCAQRPAWTFLATGTPPPPPAFLCLVESNRQLILQSDIDESNIHHARRNIDRNGLQARIRLTRTRPEDPLIQLDAIPPSKMLDFTMCNPPFYESREELLASAKAKQRPPNSACTGADIEMVTAGGETAFVSRMIEESLKLYDKVQWYTSMLGKLSSVTTLVEQLVAAGNKNWAVTQFVQGSKTKRWAIAWSWKDLRPTMEVARNIPSIPKHLLPFPAEFILQPEFEPISLLIRKINDEMGSLRISWRWDQHACKGLGFAMENVWSRQARRKMHNLASQEQGSESVSVDETKAALGLAVYVRQTGIENVGITIRWIKGFDAVLFESFCGMFKRKIGG